MTGRTHDAIAFASLITVANYYPPTNLNFLTLVACLIGTTIGALSPDLDQATNRLWHFLPGGNFTGRLLQPLFLGHRNLSHSLVGVYLYHKVLLWLLPHILNGNFVNTYLIYGSIIIGYISHLIADSVTEEGLPLFFPFKFKVGFPPVASWRIKTDHWFEHLVVLPGTLVYLTWFVIRHREQLVSVLRLINS